MKSLVDIVPADWSTHQVRFFSDTYSGGTPLRSNESFYSGDINWVKSSELKNKYLYKTEEHITEEAINKSSARWVNSNTILFAMYGATAGDLCILMQKSTTNQAVLAIPVNKEPIENEFLYYALKYKTQKLKFITQGGGQPNLSKCIVDKTPISHPKSSSEQKAIAGILSEVDEAIEAVESSINSAERLKKSLMQNLLTGKLKPDGTWRSEDEFYVDDKLGKVPKGWEVKPVGDKSLCNINPNYNFSKGEQYDFIPMDAINDKFRGVGYFDTKKVDGGGYTRFRTGDILFAKITPCTENGKVALIEKMNTSVGFASTEFIVFQPKETIDSQFYFYLLSSDRVHNLSVSLMEGTTGRQRVPWKVFKNRISAAIPIDLDEQRNIAGRLKAIEQSNVFKNLKVQSLKKLKKALMQNLLTGKVRVDVEKINKLLEEV